MGNAAPPQEKIPLLKKQANIWISCVRSNGRPHLTPVWFVWHNDNIYIGIDPKSVKMRSLRQNPQVALALEDGSHPLICEGKAQMVNPPYSDGLLEAFLEKYEWNLIQDLQFHQVVEITPAKWLSW